MGERARASIPDDTSQDADGVGRRGEPYRRERARIIFSLEILDGPESTEARIVRRWARWTLGGIVAGLLVVQVVPYGRNHVNPPVRQEPAWDNPQTRQLAVRACFDCHSNQTVWPWYSNFAPVSWLVQRDVQKGRRTVNYSEWDRPQEEAGESAKTVQKGTMPPWYYPWARLSSAEREALERGLQATLGAGHGEREKEGERDRR